MADLLRCLRHSVVRRSVYTTPPPSCLGASHLGHPNSSTPINNPRYLNLLRCIFFVGLATGLTGCQVPYLLQSAYHQSKILASRQQTKDALKDNSLTEEQKNKIRLAEEALNFAEQELKLKRTGNYRSYVKINGPYVTYVVTAAPKDKLEHYLWSFPIVGAVPYKGYFSIEGARKEANTFDKSKFDTYVRGVTAYSTLGWFDDPLLSTMLQYSAHDLVNVVIHETVHATIYIKSNADFNERLATFIGNKGTELFFIRNAQRFPQALSTIRAEMADEKLFSEFISKELAELKSWYANTPKPIDETQRQTRLAEIQKRFLEGPAKQIKSGSYSNFTKDPLNNAILLTYQTYISDMQDFEKAFQALDSNFANLLAFCKNLEKAKDPETELRQAFK